MSKDRRKTKGNDPKHHTTVRIDLEMWKELEAVADLKRMSATSVIEVCLEAGLPRLREQHREFVEGEQK